jgi:hypothetical protein
MQGLKAQLQGFVILSIDGKRDRKDREHEEHGQGVDAARGRYQGKRL